MPNTSRTLDDAAKAIDTQLKAAFPRSKFVVTPTTGENNDYITVELMSAPVSPFAQQRMYRAEISHWAIQNNRMDDESLKGLTEDGFKLMRRVVEIVLSNRLRHVADPNPLFVFTLAVGGRNEPFEVTE